MQSRENEGHLLSKTDFDGLFDIHLRPLKSRNARIIFKNLVEARKVDHLTTLDIQDKIAGLGIRLSKKEINWQLRSLQKAGLVSRDVKRGKPTTLEYEGKYTFDLWRITEQGVRIAEGLSNMLRSTTSIFEDDAVMTLEKLVKADADQKKLTLQRLEDLYILSRLLHTLLEMGGEMNKRELRRRLKLNDKEMASLLANCQILIVRRPRQRSLKMRLLSVLGLSSDRRIIYALTDRGRRLAKAIWPDGDFRHKPHP